MRPRSTHTAWAAMIANCLRIPNDYAAHPDRYVWTYTYKKRGKERKIVTYKNSCHGRSLKDLHRAMDRYMRRHYSPMGCSYACREGGGILPCLMEHIRSDTFLKLDIASFFDSIDPAILRNRIADVFGPSSTWLALRDLYALGALYACLKTSLYNGSVPVGFATSPILADLYLRPVDRLLSGMSDPRSIALSGFEALDQWHEISRSVVYTRYADDFILSASGDEGEKILYKARDVLAKCLAESHLSVNERKTYVRRLRAPGDAIHLLGLNLVKTEEGLNRITVSNSYLRETSLAWAEHIRLRGEMTEQARNRDLLRISGMARFILNASPACYEKLCRLVLIKTGAPLVLPGLPSQAHTALDPRPMKADA